nr:hypothetical protein [Lachnospiraceae bacterium]
MTLKELSFKVNGIDASESYLMCAKQCRDALGDAIDIVYEKSQLERPKKATMLELIDSPVVTTFLNNSEMVNALHYVRILGMNAEHGKAVRKKEAELALENIKLFVYYLETKEASGDSSFKLPKHMNELETRRLYVDKYLEEAGWEVLEKKNVPQPGKAGIEIEVSGMPNKKGEGYCDYVLYGRDCKPLAIVEVKKTALDPAVGRHQVDLYGDCMEKVYGYRPVLYYTNGYETKVIDGIYPDRTVMAFHTLQELE